MITGNTSPSFIFLQRTGTTNTGIGTATNLTIQSDGKILLVGYRSNGNNNDFSVTRLTTNGNLDNSFGIDGNIVIDANSYSQDEAQSIAIQTDGGIVLGGNSPRNSYMHFAAVKLNTNGNQDNSFGEGGTASIDLSVYGDVCTSMIADTNGKVFLAGYSYSSYGPYYNYTNFSVVKLNIDGSLDTSFSEDGKVMIDVGGYDDKAYSLAIQTDGKLILGGYSSNESDTDYSVIRLNADGSLDASFSGDGKATIDIDNHPDEAYSVAIQTDGKVILGGVSVNGTSSDISAVRLNSDGSLDNSFGTNGKVIIDIGGAIFNDQILSLAIQSNGKILMGGSSIVRLNTDGSLDTTFDEDGISTVGGAIQVIKTQTDGKILVAGWYGAVTRLNADGSLDTSFGTAAGDGSASTSLGCSVAYTENTTPVVIDSSVVLNDAELDTIDNYAGSNITLVRHGGANAQDVFSGSGALSFSGENAVLSGVVIGTFSNAGGKLVITFNSNATQAKVNTVLSAIAYSNTSDAPPASVQIDWTFNDGSTDGALSVTDSTTVNITSINDAPTASNRTMTIAEDTVRAMMVADFGFVDVDTGDSLQSITITRLSNAGSLKLSGTAVTLNQVISVTDISAGHLVFTPIANANGATYANWGFKVSDGKTVSASDYTMNVKVTAVRDDLTKTGTSGNDTLTGDSIDAGSYDRLNGLDGNDSLNGSGGNDTLDGGAGNDTLNGGTGIDSMVGGDGSDTYYVDDPSDKLVETNATASTGGIDLVLSYLSTYTLGTNVENGRIMSADSANITGNSLGNVLYAGKGNNVINGGSGSDIVSYAYGVNGTQGVTISLATSGAQNTIGSGTDTLTGIENVIGSSNADTIIASAGNNIINGGAGIDTVSYEKAINLVTIDLSQTTAQTTTNSGTDTLIGIENITGSGYNDKLKGSSIANSISGANGNDTLSGEDGNDTLTGGAGNDSLTGGNGADRFVFSSTNHGIDIITDFKSGTDKIIIDGTGFGITEIHFNTAESTLPTPIQAKPYLLYNKSNGQLWFDKDGTGSGGAIQIAQLEKSLLSDTRTLLTSDIFINSTPTPPVEKKLSTAQSELLTSLKNGYSDAFSSVAGVNISATGFIANRDINSGQCVSYVKNARSDLSLSWGGGAKDGLETFSTTHIINNNIPIIGSAFILDSGAKSIKPISGNPINVAASGTYGHTGIVTSVDLVRNFDTNGNATYEYNVGVRDSNRNNDFPPGPKYAETESQATAAMRDSIIPIEFLPKANSDLISYIWDKNDDTFKKELTQIQDIIGKLFDEQLISSSTGRDSVVKNQDIIDVFYVANTKDKLINYLNLIELLNIEKLNDKASTKPFTAPLATDLSITSILVKNVLTGAQVGAGTSNDTMKGTDANDIFMGGAGNDSLDGGGGFDELIGGLGDDSLSGGVGRDTLTGGVGNDIFDFNTITELGLGSTNRDVITDFTVGQDKIDLSTIDTNTSLAGNQAFAFVTAFTATVGQVRYSGGIVYLNTDTDTAAEYEIQLIGTVPAALTAANFVL